MKIALIASVPSHFIFIIIQPELLAFKDQREITKIELQNPYFDTNKPKRFWITDYPILCYYQRSQDDNRDHLMMVNLIDQDCRQVDIPLEDGQEFLSFVDRKNSRHAAIINVLVKDTKFDDELYVCEYSYENPFEKR